MEGGRFRRRLVIALVIAALVIFGWTYIRTHGLMGEKPDCAPERQVEHDADGKVTRIPTHVCAQN